MTPRITYTYAPDGRILSAHVSGLVGKVQPQRNTGVKGKQ